MTASNSEQSYLEGIEQRMDEKIKYYKKRERRILKGMGLQKLPEELELYIFSRKMVETMRKEIRESPKTAHTTARIFTEAAIFVEVLKRTKKKQL